MSRFSTCFLLIFGQLAVGGVAGLAVPPFATLERGFYKSSAGIYLGFAVVFLIGRIALLVRAGSMSAAEWVELLTWTGFTVALAVYLASLWRDSNQLRARSFIWSLALGLAAIVVSADSYRLGGWLTPATVLYPLAFLSGALALGAVTTGMLLGHWYLIDVGLSVTPLRRTFRYFVAVLLLQVGVGAITIVVMALVPGPGADAVASLWHEHGRLLATRVILGPAAALAIAYMIGRTLAIPQTMAATGLFYIAILSVMIGELLGRLILFRTSLPL